MTPKEVSNWFLGEVGHKLNVDNISIIEFAAKVSPEMLTGLILNARSKININTAKSVFEDMYQTGKSSDEIIKERGLARLAIPRA